jgi:predicted DNA-binding protein
LKLESTYAKGYVYPLKLPQDIQENLKQIVNKLGCTKAEAIRDAIKYYAEYLEGLEVVNMRNITEEEAKKEVQAYLSGKDRVTADRISDDLRLDLNLVNRVLLALWKEGEVEPLE